MTIVEGPPAQVPMVVRAIRVPVTSQWRGSPGRGDRIRLPILGGGRADVQRGGCRERQVEAGRGATGVVAEVGDEEDELLCGTVGEVVGAVPSAGNGTGLRSGGGAGNRVQTTGTHRRVVTRTEGKVPDVGLVWIRLQGLLKPVTSHNW